MVFRLALGCMPLRPFRPPLAIEFLRTLPPDTALLTLSRRPLRGREEVLPMACSFCWCRRSRSRRAKHRVHSWHSNGFSLVCDRSCLFKCSSLAKERPQVPQTCGLGLSVLGGGSWPLEAPFCEAPFPLDAGRAAAVSHLHDLRRRQLNVRPTSSALLAFRHLYVRIWRLSFQVCLVRRLRLHALARSQLVYSSRRGALLCCEPARAFRNDAASSVSSTGRSPKARRGVCWLPIQIKYQPVRQMQERVSSVVPRSCLAPYSRAPTPCGCQRRRRRV